MSHLLLERAAPVHVSGGVRSFRLDYCVLANRGDTMDVRLTTVDSTRFLTNPYDTYVGKSLEVYGEWSYGEVELFSKLLRPDSNVVEIGANIGAHTVFIARDICLSGLVYAFEPRRLLFLMLCANVTLNGISNVHAFQRAAGSKRLPFERAFLAGNQPSNLGGYPLGTLPGDSESIELFMIDECAKP
jgi:FkbM family methyltransferase